MSQKHTPSLREKGITFWHATIRWANRHEWLFLLWTVLIVLRLPNLVEPYWYGDEAIYLTLGTAMRHGVKLYQGIVDHKTPLIYYFAMVPTQFWFRVLLIGWMMATTAFFYSLAKKLLRPLLAFSSTLTFVILTTLPTFEGNIPNGELFVMGFVIAALWMLGKTSWLARLLGEKNTSLTRHDYLWIAGAGFTVSLGILTKVPGILDMGAIGALMLFALISSWKKPHRLQQLKELVFSWLIFGCGVLLPILLSIGYYALRGTLNDYIQFGLLYNFHYSGNWGLPFTQPLLLKLFTLPGKALILMAGFFLTLGLTTWKKKNAALTWSIFWSLAALFAALLSNRPYPHYFLQIVPPFVLVAGLSLQRHASWPGRVLTGLLAAQCASVLILLQFRPYPSSVYYAKYWLLMTGRLSAESYRTSFNSFVSQNDILARTIASESTENDRIFIWGTNPMLYALTQRTPATRFTVAFHIHDLKVYKETMEEVRQQKPTFIVIMKQESELPGLKEYLHEHYLFTAETTDMVLFRRSSLTSLQLIQ